MCKNGPPLSELIAADAIKRLWLTRDEFVGFLVIAFIAGAVFGHFFDMAVVLMK